MDKYRADIDGLRAVAVVPVILFHLGFQSFSGGYLGVDVFFVISGYLITSIILNQIGAGKFSILDFYGRRAKRILPALFLMIILSAVVSYYVLFPHQIKDFSQSIVATALFLSNYFFYLETDYFNPFTNHAPLLHTWSLAVEEQFYIFFPPLLLILYRFGKTRMTQTILAIGVISFVSSLMLLETNRNLAFYSIHTRAWELALGALATINRQWLVDKITINTALVTERLQVNLLTLAGLLSIVVPIFMFDSSTQHPGWPTLIPVLGTVLLLLLSDRPGLVNSILSNRVAVAIGLLSYSLYIFHQPVISFFYFSGLDVTQPMILSLCILIIVALSYASYRLVEQPIRYSKALPQNAVLTTAFSLICLFSLVGFYGHHKDGFIDYYVAKFQRQGGVALVDADAEKGRILSFRKKVRKLDESASSSESSDTPQAGIDRKKILVLGDSMGNDAYLSLSKIKFENESLPFEIKYFRVDDECIDFFIEKMSAGEEDRYHCEYGKFSLRKAAAEIAQADTVILSSKWQETTYRSALTLAEFVFDRNPDAKMFVSGVVFFQDMTSMSMKLAKLGVKPEESDELMYKAIRFDRLVVSDKLKELVETDHRLAWIEKSDFFCDLRKHSCHLFDKSGRAKIWDNAHLTYRTLSEFGEFLKDRIDHPNLSSGPNLALQTAP